MRLQSYLKNCQLDLRLFAFLFLLMALYRLIFMVKYAGAMSADVMIADIFQANWAGWRLSLKSAGGFTLLSFLLVTLPGLVRPKWSMPRLRVVIGAVACFILTVLFLARFPYYEEFRMTYGLQVFQGWHDDRAAVLGMMVSEYHLLPGLLVAAVITGLLVLVLKKVLALPVWQKQWQKPVVAAVGAFVLTCL
nr:hypothetical protein [Selenomonas sp.]